MGRGRKTRRVLARGGTGLAQHLNEALGQAGPAPGEHPARLPSAAHPAESPGHIQMGAPKWPPNPQRSEAPRETRGAPRRP